MIETQQEKIKFDELKKSVLRKIRQVDYKNTSLIPGYTNVESEYKGIRSTTVMLKDCLKTFRNYEYGNRLMKLIGEGINFLDKKANMNMYKHADMFEKISAVGNQINVKSSDEVLKESGKRMAAAYSGISESKKAFNSKVRELCLEIDQIQNEAEKIDKLRKRVFTTRYDLEVLIQDGGYNNEIKKASEKVLEKELKDALKAMNDFIKNTDISSILKRFSAVHLDYLKASSELLDTLK